MEGMCGAGKAIDAAMLAPAIGVDGTVEGDVRRLVEAEDGFGTLLGDRCAQFCEVCGEQIEENKVLFER